MGAFRSTSGPADGSTTIGYDASGTMAALYRVLRSPWTTLAGLLIIGSVLSTSLVHRSRAAHLPGAYIAAEQGIAGGSLERGKAELEAHLAEHPADSYALRLMGVILLNLGENAEGVRCLERSTAVNPHQPRLARYLRSVGRPTGLRACPGDATDELFAPPNDPASQSPADSPNSPT